jgi:predicted SprT family Zn-dependent metalloprotease
MNIPKTFQLYGQTIEVRLTKDTFYTCDAYGLAEYRKNIISLQEPIEGLEVPRQMLEQVFCHELTHFLLDRVGGKIAEDLRDNEEFVDRLGSLIHQFIVTQNGIQ